MSCDFTFRPINNWLGNLTSNPERSRFKTNYSVTLKLLEKELTMLEVQKAVIQLDLPESKIRLDGLPRVGADPNNQGIILSFESKYGPLRYATDTFDRWKDNLRAIALGLEALRKVDRYGITKHGEQYTGWKQLPEPTTGFADIHGAAAFIEEHSDFIDNNIIRDLDIRKRAYRQASLKLHPDKEHGEHDLFCKLQEAKRVLDGK